MDSKLVVEQMSGRWKIKHEDMRRLALEARDIAAEVSAAGGSVRFTWIPREENAAAGPIDLDDEFPSGDDAPTAHPNCECALMPVVYEASNQAATD